MTIETLADRIKRGVTSNQENARAAELLLSPTASEEAREKAEAKVRERNTGIIGRTEDAGAFLVRAEAAEAKVASLTTEIALWLERMPQIKDHPANLDWLTGRMLRALSNPKPGKSNPSAETSHD